MVNYYIERTIQALLTVFAVITLSFGMIRFLPGGPMDYLRAQLIDQSDGQVDMERINRRVERYTNVQPDEALLDQYVSYMTRILQGNLGHSIWYDMSVNEILIASLPWTIFVMSLSIFFTFGIGITLGAAMGYAEASQFDSISSVISILTNSIPYYILAVMALYLVGYRYPIFPTGGRVADGVSGLDFYVSALYHAVLPVTSFVVTAFGLQALAMRGNSIRVLGDDYLRVAKLRGLPSHIIALRYVGRNAILPMYTGLMISIGFLFGGAVILEEIFRYPGVGYYMFQAISARDYPLMMGAFIVITVAVVISVYIADLTYGKLDPRASGGDDREAY
jgi:peptide/nickel transport system permease protein